MRTMQHATHAHAKHTTDPKLLEILMCPLTRGTLHYDAEKQELRSVGARMAFPIRGGIPIMLASEARVLDEADWKK